MPDVLFNSAGKRLYLTHDERLDFMAAVGALPRKRGNLGFRAIRGAYAVNSL